jgi:hypothetical protein
MARQGRLLWDWAWGLLGCGLFFLWTSLALPSAGAPYLGDGFHWIRWAQNLSETVIGVVFPTVTFGVFPYLCQPGEGEQLALG